MNSAKGVPIGMHGAMPARGFRISACRFPDRPNTWPSGGPLGRGTSISPEILLPSNRCGQAASESCHFPTLAGYIRARRTAEAIDLEPLRRVADSYIDPNGVLGSAASPSGTWQLGAWRPLFNFSTGSFRCLALGGLQNPEHGKYCVPTACCRRRTEEFVDSAKIADCLHTAPVDSKDKPIPRPDDSYEPLPNFGNYDRKARLAATSFRQDAHKLNNIRARGLSSKRILHFQSDKIAAAAERNFRFKPQLPTQFSKEPGTRPGFSDDKRARSADIHNIIGGQFSCQHAWAERPVTSNVDPSQKNNERHSPSADATIRPSAGLAEVGGAHHHDWTEVGDVHPTRRPELQCCQPLRS